MLDISLKQDIAELAEIVDNQNDMEFNRDAVIFQCAIIEKAIECGYDPIIKICLQENSHLILAIDKPTQEQKELVEYAVIYSNNLTKEDVAGYLKHWVRNGNDDFLLVRGRHRMKVLDIFDTELGLQYMKSAKTQSIEGAEEYDWYVDAVRLYNLSII